MEITKLALAPAALSAAGAAALFMHYPAEPGLVPDSYSYIHFASHRPHGYSALLQVYRWFGGSTHLYLPYFQTALFALSVVFLAITVNVRTRSHLPGLAVVAASFVAPGLYFASVVPDAVLMSWLAIAAACFSLWVQTRRNSLLIAAAFYFALTAVTKTVGYGPLLLFVGFVIGCARAGAGSKKAGKGTLLALLPIALVLCSAAASNSLRNGSFSIGSNSGTSLLGKGLLVAGYPECVEHHPGLASACSYSSQAYRHIDGEPNLILRSLVARQYYERVRWGSFMPAAEKNWPEWKQASVAERKELAESVAISNILDNPGRYGRLALLDYWALWTVPRFLTGSEERRLRATYRDLHFDTPLARAERNDPWPGEYHQVVPAPRSAFRVWAVRALSLGFFLSSAAMLVAVAASRRARALAKRHLDIVFMMAAVHLAYLGTAATESGALERYLTPFWPMLGAVCGVAVLLLARRLARLAPTSRR